MHLTLITLGALFLVGLVADELGRRTRLPRVTLLVLLGVLIGPVGLNFLPAVTEGWYDFVASIALTMVAFLLGEALSREQIKTHGREIIRISIIVVLVTVALVFGGLVLLGVAPVLALLLAGIATATDPAATEEVIRQTRAEGHFSGVLKGIVAIDDAWGLITFSIILAFANFLTGNGVQTSILHGLFEIAGAVAVGIAVGVPAAALTGRLRPGEPQQAEALVVVFLCAGFARWIEVSYLLAGITAGTIVANFARHHKSTFREIEFLEWPFMLVFFLLSGAMLHTDHWASYGVLIGAYLVLRTGARLVGGWLGARLAGSTKTVRIWIGAALLPQAGVAVGMALVAGSQFPALQETILNMAIITTVLFEILGPIATRLAIVKNESAQDPDAL